jgi:hypothetical protein
MCYKTHMQIMNMVVTCWPHRAWWDWSICVVSWNACEWNAIWAGGACSIPVGRESSVNEDAFMAPGSPFSAMQEASPPWDERLLLLPVVWSSITEVLRAKAPSSAPICFTQNPELLSCWTSEHIGMYYRAQATKTEGLSVWLKQQNFTFSQFWRILRSRCQEVGSFLAYRWPASSVFT